MFLNIPGPSLFHYFEEKNFSYKTGIFIFKIPHFKSKKMGSVKTLRKVLNNDGTY
jgi:hypothetical protein